MIRFTSKEVTPSIIFSLLLLNAASSLGLAEQVFEGGHAVRFDEAVCHDKPTLDFAYVGGRGEVPDGVNVLRSGADSLHGNLKAHELNGLLGKLKLLGTKNHPILVAVGQSVQTLKNALWNLSTK